MRDIKNKNLAALLAFFGGIVGLQRFYLGQKKLGFFMIFLAIVTMGVVSSIIGVIDAIAFLSMSEEKFDYKYNNKDTATRHTRRRPRYKSYEGRYESHKYAGEKDTTYRRDRRMNKREYRERKKNRESKRSGPYRRTKKERSSKEKRQIRKQALKKIQEHKEKGIEKFKDYDIEGSIVEFQSILKIDPHHVASHFNLACAWSQLENPDKSMYHIDHAVRVGFDDFDRIRKHNKLAYVRIQPEWEEFAKNGFVFDVNENTGGTNKVDVEMENVRTEEDMLETEEDRDENAGDLLQHLSKLKEQREKGIISETEFELERRKLMSS